MRIPYTRTPNVNIYRSRTAKMPLQMTREKTSAADSGDISETSFVHKYHMRIRYTRTPIVNIYRSHTAKMPLQMTNEKTSAADSGDSRNYQTNVD